jgi:hypothetical protein
MWPYWLMFLVPAWAALNEFWQPPAAVRGWRPLRLERPWLVVVLLLTLLIGFRYRVGGDWGNYFGYLYRLTGVPLAKVLQLSDPGYQLLNWLSLRANWDIYGVNLLGGFLFAVGLAVFCRSLPRPWLALAVAVPYLLIVVAMGYSRQGIALGLAMLGLVALGRQSTPWFVIWVLLGATFHKSAVVLLPIAALAATRNRYWVAFWVGMVGLAAYTVLLEESVESLRVNYIEAGYQSQGAAVRGLMNALPAAIFLLWRRRFFLVEAERNLWFWISLISLTLAVLALTSTATTAVDRIGLYMLPLQMVVFAHLPEALGRPGFSNNAWVLAVLGYYAAVQFVWLNFAIHARWWVPYRFFPLEAVL